jgi:hypothetical protein
VGIFAAVDQVVLDAERQLREGEWKPVAGDPALALQTAASLDQTYGCRASLVRWADTVPAEALGRTREPQGLGSGKASSAWRARMRP